MPEKTRKVLFMTLRMLPVVISAVLVVLGFIYRDSLTVENIMYLVSDNKLQVAFVMIALYAVKSMSIVVPMLILNVATGILMPPAWALVVNVAGICVMTALPYFVGLFSGAHFYQKIKKKYPKVALQMEQRRDSVFFFSFFLRVISCLPGDIVSLFFGAMKVDFLKYFSGSVLGILPGVITATFMGYGVMNPKSKTFIISLLINVSLSVISIVLHLYMKHKRQGKDKVH